jgi:alpha-glucuronidase
LRDGVVIAGTKASSPLVAALDLAADLARAGEEGYVLRAMSVRGHRALVIAANSDVGVLYGAFALLERIATSQRLDSLAVVSAPRLRYRLLDHWDKPEPHHRARLRRLLALGLAEAARLHRPALRDYARANASIGINGSVITSVNANATSLTAEWLAKAAALASVFRPYGIRVYLTARFSAPIEIGGLKTADPLDPEVPRGGRARPTRSTASSRISAASW